MSATRLRLASVGAVLLALAACDAPSAPRVETAARLVRGSSAAFCDPLTNPLCTAFQTTEYRYDPTIAPLPPGVSDWTLKVTQIGGVLEFFGAITKGGSAIPSMSNMYVRFYLDNGDETLGAGDLMVVIRSNFGSANIYCGLVTTLPSGSVIPPTDAPSLCPVTGFGYDDGTRFIFDGFRTTDLSEPISSEWEPFTAGDSRALYLFEVGNVAVSGSTVTLLPATAPVTVAYGLGLPAGPPPIDTTGTGGGGGEEEEEEEDPTDSTPPVITFVGNAGNYTLMQHVTITCEATDDESGVASLTCPTIDAPAYTFGAGPHSVPATASDSAGNITASSTTFNVVVTADGLCALTRQFATNHGIATALCAKLSAPGQVKKNVEGFIKQVRSQRGKALSTTHADILIALAETLL